MEAEALSATLAIDRRTMEHEYPEVARKLVNVALVMAEQGRVEAAESFVGLFAAIRSGFNGKNNWVFTSAH